MITPKIPRYWARKCSYCGKYSESWKIDPKGYICMDCLFNKQNG